MASRQERTARATKRAAEQAEAIIEKATERAAVKKCPVCGERGTVARLREGGHGRACPLTPITYEDLIPEEAATCKKMREEGKSWMAIGATLGLPGAKNGAAAARKLYAQYYGSYAETKVATKPKKEKPAAAGNNGPRYARVEKVINGENLFASMSDRQVEEYVAGKTIVWLIDLRRLAGGKGEPAFSEQDAQVHPTDLLIEAGVRGPDDRCLRFRQLLGEDKHGRPISGPTRTVRLTDIHTVR